MIDGLNRDDPGWQLLEAYLQRAAPGRVLWMHSGEPRQGADSVWRAILDERERLQARARCVEPRIPGEADPLGALRFDAVAYWPRAHLGKDFSLACFGRAALHLEAGGALYLCARKQKGLKSLAAQLETLFGDVETLQRSRGYHLLRAEAGPGVDRALAEAWAETRYEIQDELFGELRLSSAPGVFSRRSLDAGTRALILHVDATQVREPGRVLDLCAGVGPLAIWAATRWPAAQVRAVESNLLACALARRSVEAAQLGARVHVDARVGLEPEGVPEAERADLVLVNPPTHAGPEALHALLEPLPRHLRSQGRALLVVNRAGRTQGVLEGLGARVTVHAAPGFSILEASWLAD